jgi:hypothetical protein
MSGEMIQEILRTIIANDVPKKNCAQVSARQVVSLYGIRRFSPKRATTQC